MLRSHRQLVVWQRSMTLVQEIFELTRELPEQERFGLSNQLRRAAVSIPSNIAEGYSRETRREYLRHLVIARGSLAELETQLLILVRVGYVDRVRIVAAYDLQRRVGAMLVALIRRLRGERSVPKQAIPDTRNPIPVR